MMPSNVAIVSLQNVLAGHCQCPQAHPTSLERVVLSNYLSPTFLILGLKHFPSNEASPHAGCKGVVSPETAAADTKIESWFVSCTNGALAGEVVLFLVRISCCSSGQAKKHRTV